MFFYRLIYTVAILIALSVILAESKSSTSKNHELLSKIGFSRVRAPNSHHRKRLAVESRHHSRSDDSHMFIIKLPPNQHYYVHNKPNTYSDSSKKIPVGFKNNGKPAKIYHWNIPVLKKINAHRSKLRLNDSPDVQQIKYKSSWNEVLEKPERKESRTNYKKQSYYVPTKPKKSSFFKYFPGNGKPKSFYVIEKSKKQHYHRLLP